MSEQQLPPPNWRYMEPVTAEPAGPISYATRSIPVRARMAWRHPDLEVEVPALAVAWTACEVLVEWESRPDDVIRVWLEAGRVTRT